LPRHRPEQLYKHPAAREIGVEHNLELGAPERQTRLRQYNDALLLEVASHLKPMVLKVVGHLGEERHASAVVAVRPVARQRPHRRQRDPRATGHGFELGADIAR
jgi:hypothetical protein